MVNKKKQRNLIYAIAARIVFNCTWLINLNLPSRLSTEKKNYTQRGDKNRIGLNIYILYFEINKKKIYCVYRVETDIRNTNIAKAEPAYEYYVNK